MKKYSLYFFRKGKCNERLFDDAYSCIRYVRRYLGAIKDYEIFPRYCSNASLVQVEIELPEGLVMYAKIYAPLGSIADIEEVLLS